VCIQNDEVTIEKVLEIVKGELLEDYFGPLAAELLLVLIHLTNSVDSIGQKEEKKN
jgi:hypothetical protein